VLLYVGLQGRRFGIQGQAGSSAPFLDVAMKLCSGGLAK